MNAKFISVNMEVHRVLVGRIVSFDQKLFAHCTFLTDLKIATIRCPVYRNKN